jgi:hypothetical protein
MGYVDLARSWAAEAAANTTTPTTAPDPAGMTPPAKTGHEDTGPGPASASGSDAMVSLGRNTTSQDPLPPAADGDGPPPAPRSRPDWSALPPLLPVQDRPGGPPHYGPTNPELERRYLADERAGMRLLH